MLLDAVGVACALQRMGDALRAGSGGDAPALVGIRRRGVPLAYRLARLLAAHGVEAPVGELDIALYRDDFLERAAQPVTYATSVPFGVAGRRVVLVDDVFYTGRTARAALQAITDLGRPGRLELAVLVDRGQRELPIRPDVVGLEVLVPGSQWVEVRLVELDGYDGVYLFDRPVPG